MLKDALSIVLLLLLLFVSLLLEAAKLIIHLNGPLFLAFHLLCCPLSFFVVFKLSRESERFFIIHSDQTLKNNNTKANVAFSIYFFIKYESLE